MMDATAAASKENTKLDGDNSYKNKLKIRF